MKKYKIGNRIIKADSIIDAVKISKMLDSPNTRVKSRDDEIEELTQEEQQAVEDYREAIRNTSNPKLLKIYSHILEEETEHLQELAEAKEIDDACGQMTDSPVLGTVKQSAHIPVFTGYANKFLNGDESVKSQLENELKNVIQDLSYDTSNLPSQFKQEVKANYRSVRNICEKLYREHKLELAMRFMFMYDNRL